MVLDAYWVLCLNFFLSVGMLFVNVSIWEWDWNCYKCKGKQVVTVFKCEMYGKILVNLLYPLIIIIY